MLYCLGRMMTFVAVINLCYCHLVEGRAVDSIDALLLGIAHHVVKPETKTVRSLGGRDWDRDWGGMAGAGTGTGKGSQEAWLGLKHSPNLPYSRRVGSPVVALPIWWAS